MLEIPETQKRPRPKKLAYRLIALITFFGLLVTGISTVIQINIEEDREIGRIAKRFQQVHQGYLQSVAENLWLLDTRRLHTILEGISQLPDFQYAEVLSDTGEVKATMGEDMASGGVTVSTKVPYVHRGKERTIGQFKIVAHLDGVNDRMVREAGLILSNVGMIIFTFAVIIYFAVYQMITRHMSHMAEYARKFSMDNIDQELRLGRKNESRRHDELHDLVIAINEMRINLKLSYDELQSLNAELESRVNERTRDLTEEIAERKKALSKLQEALSLNETILEASPIGIAIFDNMGQCIVANKAIADLFEDTKEAFLKQNYRRRDDWYNPRLSDLAVQTSEGGAPSLEEVKLVTLNDREIEVENQMVPFMSGDKTHMMWLVSDATERKALQLQLIQSSKMATLGEMATGVAHELNQPLHIIRMAADSLKRRLKKNNLEEDYALGKLGRIDKQTERAASIIDHMRIFGHKSSAEKERIDLRHSVASVLDMMGEQIVESGIKVETQLPDIATTVLGHEVQIEQVLLNLMGNARDAILDNQGISERTIEIIIEENSRESQIELSVCDTGGGIPAALLDRVFEPFFTTKEVGEGTGLGLSIIYGIVQDMGGDIRVENSDKGACFTLSMEKYI